MEATQRLSQLLSRNVGAGERPPSAPPTRSSQSSRCSGRQVRALSFCLPFRPGDIGASPLHSQPSPSCLLPVGVSVYCLLRALIISLHLLRKRFASEPSTTPSAAHRGLTVGTEARGDESPLLKNLLSKSVTFSVRTPQMHKEREAEPWRGGRGNSLKQAIDFKT